MTILLELREWLSLEEATELINSHLPTHRIFVSDLAPLIEESLLPIYMKSNRGLTCIEVKLTEYQSYKLHTHYADSKQSYIQGEHLLLDVKSSFKSGFCKSFDLAMRWDERYAQSGQEPPLFTPIFWCRKQDGMLLIPIDHDDAFNISNFSQYYTFFVIPDLLRVKKIDIKNLITKITEKPEEITPSSSLPKDLAPKAKNDYLRTIHALADKLIDGLTGKPNSDAAAIKVALGESCPVSEKTLAGYLSEAAKVPKKG